MITRVLVSLLLLLLLIVRIFVIVAVINISVVVPSLNSRLEWENESGSNRQSCSRDRSPQDDDPSMGRMKSSSRHDLVMMLSILCCADGYPYAVPVPVV